MKLSDEEIEEIKICGFAKNYQQFQSILRAINHLKEHKESWERVARTLEEEKQSFKSELARLAEENAKLRGKLEVATRSAWNDDL